MSERSLLLAIVLAAALPACTGPEAAPDGEAPIPIAATHREIVVATSTLKGELTFSIVGLKRKGNKDDGTAGWEDRFEEQVEAPHEGFVRRRFRVTLDNESDQARQYAIEIDYVSDTNGEVILSRAFRKILVPPWTRKQVSGYTPIRADRAVHADLRVVDVTEGR